MARTIQRAEPMSADFFFLPAQTSGEPRLIIYRGISAPDQPALEQSLDIFIYCGGR